jgi:hypothetical protein
MFKNKMNQSIGYLEHDTPIVQRHQYSLSTRLNKYEG